MLYTVIYTDRFIPNRFAAYEFGPFVFIRPKYKNDLGLLHHELTHVRQFWRNPLMGLFYTFSKKSRAYYEIQAYRVQLKFYPDDRSEMFAKYLVDNYNLDLNLDQARAALLA